MSNYKANKEKLDKIRQEYTCKGEVIFTTAVQYTIEVGMANLNRDNWFQKTLDQIDSRHDKAEKEGKWLFMTRDFEKAILYCAKEIAEINAHDLMVYIQREMYLNSGLMDGAPDYQRAIAIIKGILSYEEDCYIGGERFIYKLDEYRLTDDEICYFGYEKYVYNEEE